MWSLRVTAGPLHSSWWRRLHAAVYEPLLRLPGIAQVRQSERQTLCDLFQQVLRPADRVLEIGSGTGFYTIELARRVRQVVALERAAAMADVLAKRLARSGLTNVTLLRGDFAHWEVSEPFDAVVAIGVLDRLPDPSDFLRRCCRLARRGVLFTVPRRGLAGTCYAWWSRLGGLRVYCYQADQLRRLLPEYPLHCVSTGWVAPGWSGLTWAVWVDCQPPAEPKPCAP